jgi:hypothetical protein
MPPRIDGRFHLSLIVRDGASSVHSAEHGAVERRVAVVLTIEQPEQPLAGGRRQLTH